MSQDGDDTVVSRPRSAASQSALPSVVRQGRFLVQDEVGRGGMGTVHLAVDTTLLRQVAMKVLDRDLGRSITYVQGFVEEAQITSQLDHPNIVPIHELGLDEEGQAFFTMKYVRGVSLGAWLRHPSRPIGSSNRLADGLEIFLKVGDAIAFAHSRGVIHRDLKPDNIMVGEFGEVYVMDWGLALLQEGHVRVSGGAAAGPGNASGGPTGTPAFMSPEAARCDNDRLNQSTDIFGLGGVLYQIVTGYTPYTGDTLKEVLALARRGDVRFPESLGEVKIPSSILRILRRALAREQADRYPTVAALQSDVRMVLRGGSHLPQRDYEPGERVVVEGELGDAAYVVIRGSCEAYKTIEGERRVLRRMGPGEVFGEMAVLSSLPRTATVEAVEPLSVLVIDRASIEEGIGLDTWIGSLVKSLALRFREIDAELHSRRSG